MEPVGMSPVVLEALSSVVTAAVMSMMVEVLCATQPGAIDNEVLAEAVERLPCIL